MSMIAVIGVYAANYTVTVSTQKQIEFRDASGSVISGKTEPGNAMTFYVVADSPYEAQQKALDQCSGACNSGIFHKEASGVPVNGVKCDKYVKFVPFNAKAELSK